LALRSRLTLSIITTRFSSTPLGKRINESCCQIMKATLQTIAQVRATSNISNAAMSLWRCKVATIGRISVIIMLLTAP
jgi:hypothetical protein